jgi:IclR family transcriptional regulator, acetate operon repressor
MKSASSAKNPVRDEDASKHTQGTRIQSVSRACQVLFWLAERRDGASAKEVAFANQLALPTAYHLLNTLAEQGLLAKEANRRFVLGSRMALLVQAYLRGSSVPESLLAGVRAMSERTKETAYLADWGEHEIRVLASVEGTNLVRVAEVASGPYQDGHSRANGKVLLAHAWPEIREAYLRAHPLRRLTENTICDRDEFEQELERVRTQGFAYDQESYAEGICCVAAPLLEDGQIVASFGVSVPAARFHKHRAELTQSVLETVADVKAGKFDAEADSESRPVS